MGGPTSARSGIPRAPTPATGVDARCVDLRQHVHVLEDRVQLATSDCARSSVEPETRERRDVPNVVERDGH